MKKDNIYISKGAYNSPSYWEIKKKEKQLSDDKLIEEQRNIRILKKYQEIQENIEMAIADWVDDEIIKELEEERDFFSFQTEEEKQRFLFYDKWIGESQRWEVKHLILIEQEGWQNKIKERFKR